MFNFIQSIAESLGPAMVIFWIFMVIVAVLWVILPFAVFGIKNRLDKLNKNVVRIGRILKRLEADDVDIQGIDQSDIDEFLER